MPKVMVTMLFHGGESLESPLTNLGEFFRHTLPSVKRVLIEIIGEFPFRNSVQCSLPYKEDFAGFFINGIKPFW